MDLWVRSQDRECLIKIENISIDNENWVLGNLVSDDNKAICDYWKLGYYKSKKRALEVLDEIQDLFITKELKTEFTKDGLTIMKEQPSSVVYKMPKE